MHLNKFQRQSKIFDLLRVIAKKSVSSVLN